MWEKIKFIVAGVVILFVFGEGYYLGGHFRGVACDADKLVKQQEEQKAKDDLQANVDKKSAEYETLRTKTKTKIDGLTKELNNEKKRNPAFASCHAGADFVRLYQGIVTSARDNSRR